MENHTLATGPLARDETRRAGSLSEVVQQRVGAVMAKDGPLPGGDASEATDSPEPAAGGVCSERIEAPVTPAVLVPRAAPALVNLAALVFSKDRPLQLDATLRSFRMHVREAGAIGVRVLYTTSSAAMEAHYGTLAREHPAVEFVREQHFKTDLVRLVGSSEFVLFLVDDTCFVREVSLGEVCAALRQQPAAIGCSLRLGRNTTYCYPLDQPQRLPQFIELHPGLLQFDWTRETHDFGYPLEVSSSVYRVEDLLPSIRELDFSNPNTLEARLHEQAARCQAERGTLLCFAQSVAFSVPLNRVQTACENRTASEPAYTAEALGRLFAEGKRIEVGALSGFTPGGCHQEIVLPIGRLDAAEPIVSVVIPCFNQAEFLAEAVESVLGQTLPDWEIIIVNDGSPDQTSEVARELIRKHPSRRMRLLEQANRGLAAARNAGIQAAVGRYILPLDADDRIRATMLERARAVLDAEPDVGFAYTDIQHFGLKNDVWRWPDFDAETLVHTDNVVSYAGLLRKSMWDQVGGYNPAMRSGYEDWDFWISCVEKGWRGQCIHEPLFCYRQRANSMLHGAHRQRIRLMAELVRNHPRCYSAGRRARADALLREDPPTESGVRVLIAGPSFWPTRGRMETVMENLGAWLVKCGYEVDVATAIRADRPYHQFRGMSILSLASNCNNGDLPWAVEFRHLLRSGRYRACLLFVDPENPWPWTPEGAVVPPDWRLAAEGEPSRDPELCAAVREELRRHPPAVYLPGRPPAGAPAPLRAADVIVPGAGQTLTILKHQIAALGDEITHRQAQAEHWKGEAERRGTQLAELHAQIPELLQRIAAVEEQAKRWKIRADRLERRRWPNRLRRSWVLLREAVTGRERGKLKSQIDRPPSWMTAKREISLHGFCRSMAGNDILRVRAVVFGMFKRRVFEADYGLPRADAADAPDGVPVALSGFYVTSRLCRGLNLILFQALVRGKWVPFSWVFPWRRVCRIPRPRQWLARALPADEKPWPEEQPLVSVVLVCHNPGPLLDETLRSVFAQTWQDFEMVVVDNGSTDPETVRRLDSLLAPKVRIQRLKKEKPGVARDAGIGLARGKFVCCVEPGRRLYPTYLERCVYRLETEGLDFCGTLHPAPGKGSADPWPKDSLQQRDLQSGDGSQTALFRRGLWEYSGGFETVCDRIYQERGDGEFFPCPTLGAATGASARLGWKELARRGSRCLPGKSLLVAKPFLMMGGAETIVSQILGHLARQGFRITLIVTEDAPVLWGDSTPLFEQNAVEIFRLPRFLPKEAWADFVFYLLKSRGVGLLWQIGSPFIYELLAAVHRQFDRIKVVDLLFNTTYHTASNRKFAHLIDLHCAESTEVRDWLLAEGEPPERVSVIPNGVDTDLLSPRDKRQALAGVAPDWDGRFIVGFFGRFSEEKAPDSFLRMAARFRGDSRFQFVMGGVGPLQAGVHALVRELRLEAQVRLLGVADVKQWIPACDVVVVPSRMDGRPNVILESFAFGVPVVGSRVGALAELIDDGETGFLCPPEDIEAFADCVRRMENAPELMARMKVRARAAAVERFPISRTFSSYTSLFEGLLAG